jgi:dihydrofolate synthase/folylpolyglutamate synthase
VVDARTVRAFVRALPDNELSGVAPFASLGAGLRRTTTLLDTLGRPDVRYLVAQVAGTNGKGSTAAMLAAILEAAGARAGLYTSPHLRRWEERIRISQLPIDDPLLARAGGLVIDAAMQIGDEAALLTRFEFWTALACVAFAEASCRAAVLEVGLGGRYDATSATRVDLAVITRIGLDHTAVLGHSRAQIAAEKAAIIRPDLPVVCALQPEDALEVIVGRARELNAPLLVCGRDVTWRRTEEGLDVTVLGQTYESLRVPLRGQYQDENAATAVAAALALGTLGIQMRPEMIAAGIAAARWPGRFEVVDDVVIDAAHNPDGAAALAGALLREFPEAVFTVVFGCHRDKDLDGMLASLAPAAKELVAVRARHPRARPAKEIADAARAAGFRVEVAETVEDGVRMARARGGMVTVCGSLAVVGEARAALGLAD